MIKVVSTINNGEWMVVGGIPATRTTVLKSVEPGASNYDLFSYKFSI